MGKSLQMLSTSSSLPSRCGICGATSYHRVVARDSGGVMRYTERLQCTGCSHEFADVKAWREGACAEPRANAQSA